MGAVSGSGLSLGTLWVAIAANVDEALQEFQKFTNDIGKMIDKQKEKWEGLATVGESFTKVGTALTVGVTAPLVGLAVVAAKTAGDFEAAMNKVQAVSDATGVEMDAMRQQAIKLGADTKFSALEAAQGMGELAAAGLNTSQVMAAMPGALNLAAAGEMSVARAAEVTVDTLGQFGLAASQAGHVADVLATAANASQVKVDQLAESLKLVGPVAKTAGLTLEETSVALSLLAKEGLKGSEAGTGLRGVLATLEAPSKKAQAALDALGVSTKDASGNMLPLDNIMLQLQKSGASAGDMFKIFSRETAAAANILKNEAGPAWAAMTAEMNKNEGAAKRMADTLMKGLKGSLEQLKGSAETAMIAIGQGLNPVFEVLVQGATSAVNALLPLIKQFSDLPTPIKAGILVLAGMAAAVGPVLVVLGQLAIAITAIGPAVAAMAAQIGVSSLALTGWIGVIGLAVAALVALVTWTHTSQDAQAKAADAEAATARFAAKKNELIAASLSQYPKLAQVYLDAAAAARKEGDQYDKTAAAHRKAAADAEKQAAAEKLAAAEREKQSKALQEQIAQNNAKLQELIKQHGAAGTAADQHGEKIGKLTDHFKELTVQTSESRGLQTFSKAVQDMQRSALQPAADDFAVLLGRTVGLNLGLTQAEKFARDTAKAFEDLLPPLTGLDQQLGKGATTFETFAIGGDKAVKAMEDLGKQLESMGAIITTLPPPIYSTYDALKALGLTSAETFRTAADEALKAYKTMEEEGKSSVYQLTQARLIWLEAEKKAALAAGEIWSAADQAQIDDLNITLDQMEQKTTKHTKKTKTIWEEWSRSIGSAIKGFIGNVVDRLFEGSDINKQLDQQAEELKQSLVTRAGEYQKSIDEIAAKQAAADEEYRTSLAQNDQDLADSLAARQKEYDDYAATVPRLLAEAEAKAKQEFEDTTAGLQRELSDRTTDYSRYVEDVTKNIEDIRTKHAEQLAGELEDLQNSLDDRTLAYERFVEDAKDSLRELQEKHGDNIADETKNVEDNIRDRTKDYSRYAEDTAKKIKQVRDKNNGVYSDEEDDLVTSLKRRQDDLQQYISDQQRDLATYKERQLRDQKEEEDNLQQSLDRKAEDQAKFQADIQTQRDQAISKHKAQQDQEIADQVTALERKTADYEQYVSDNKGQMVTAEQNYQTSLDTERGKLQKSLEDRKQDLITGQAEAYKTYTDNAGNIKTAYEQTTGDLKTELGNQKTEYENFVKDITGPGGKLEQLKEAHRSIWQDIGGFGVAAFESIGKSLAELLGEKALGALGKVLKGLIDETFPALGAAIGKVLGLGAEAAGTVATGAAGAGAGAAGAAGSVVGAVAAGPLGWASLGVSIASGIVSAVQGARQEGTLNQIERNTAGSMLFLGSRSDGGILGILFKIDEELAWGSLTKATEALKDAFINFANFALPDLDDMKGHLWKLDDISQKLDQMAMGPRQINITVSGSDPTVVASQLATMLRAQGAFG